MLDRRLFLLSPAGAILTGAMAGFSEITPLYAQPKAAAPLEERVIRIAYQRVAAKLAAESAAPSALFRMVDRDAAEPPSSPNSAPLPVFRVAFGTNLRFEIENQLPQPASFRLHGMRGANAIDGAAGLTEPAIAPGQMRQVRLVARQAGIFILGSLNPGNLSEQNGRGLAGILIVDEPNPVALEADLVLAISDWRADDAASLDPAFSNLADIARAGRLGNRLQSNSLPAPQALEARPGARLRIRIVNLSNARVLPLTVQGMEAEVIAIDSTPCEPFDPLKRSVTLAPLSRYEMRLDLPRASGMTGVILAKLGDGLPLLLLKTVGELVPARPRSPPLPDPGLPPAIRLQNAERVEIRITGGATRGQAGLDLAQLQKLFPNPRQVFRINGSSEGFASKPVAKVKRGRVLVMALFNESDWPQVIALHGHVFRLLHPYDDGWDPYFLDTLYLAPKSVARIALIADNPGRWALRSTIAEHCDGGVLGWYEVSGG
jgi:FtsP/CotA-like multicopper oxidase with cupredoxin domain